MPISENDVDIAIHRGKNTAPGPDSTNRKTMKQLPNTIDPILALLMNACLEFLYFPEAWKCANTVMIPKPEVSHTDPASEIAVDVNHCPGKLRQKSFSSRIGHHFYRKKTQVVPLAYVVVQCTLKNSTPLLGPLFTGFSFSRQNQTVIPKSLPTKKSFLLNMPSPDRTSRSPDRDQTLPNIDKMNFKELISYAQAAIVKNSYHKIDNDQPKKSYTGPHTRSRANSNASNITVQSANSTSNNPPRKTSDLTDTFTIKMTLKKLQSSVTHIAPLCVKKWQEKISPG
ncbi:hypothetical protein JTB14_009994 [Gonioctena quinquepunctata]|nr:hypothetical protein JTB14_009994 [Gonioctena quinquepunctata]